MRTVSRRHTLGMACPVHSIEDNVELSAGSIVHQGTSGMATVQRLGNHLPLMVIGGLFLLTRKLSIRMVAGFAEDIEMKRKDFLVAGA